MISSPPPPPTTNKVPTSAVKNAISALLNHRSKSTTAAKPQLLPSDDFLYLVTTLIKIPPKPRVNAFKIPLPHPLHTPSITTDLCLFVHDSNSAPVKSRIKSHNIPISKVIKLSKLKTDYKSYEQKRKLCDSYDMFLADKKVVPLLPNCIGKWFYKKKKIPVPVELGRAHWEAQIDRIVGSGLLYLGTGSCSVMKVARASMTEEEIVGNVVAAVEGVAAVVPKKWGNVRSFHLKFAESLALPVYQRVPEFGYKIDSGVSVGAEEVKKVKKVKNVEGEKSAERKKKKGRIHDVRYMDEEVGMVGGDEDGSGSESEGEEAEVVVGKMRKNGDGVKKGLKLKKGASESEEEEEAVVVDKVVGKKRKEGDGVKKGLKLKKGGSESNEKEEAVLVEKVAGKKKKDCDGVKKGLKLKKGGSESGEEEDAVLDEKVVGKKRKNGDGVKKGLKLKKGGSESEEEEEAVVEEKVVGKKRKEGVKNLKSKGGSASGKKVKKSKVSV